MRHFAKTLPAAIAWLTLSSSSTAAVIHFANEEILIPSTFTGVSVDLQTGDFNNSLSGILNGDANFSFGGANISNDADSSVNLPTWQPVRTGTTQTSSVANLDAASTIVGPGSTYASGGTALGSSATHITGGALPDFISGTSGYIGFALTPNNGSGGPWYGWMRVTLYNDGPGATGTEGIIHEWAYEDTGAAILVGAIPEPGTTGALALLGLGALARRRRRR